MEDEPKERRYLIQRPKALQYFHNGQLKKAAEKERVAGRFELFFDLLYVALVHSGIQEGGQRISLTTQQIANFAEHLTEHPSGGNLVQFILVFTPAWHAWADAKENANNYYNDDLLQRCAILWVMALLVLYGNNANEVRESLEAQRATVAAYQCIRFTQLCFFLLYSIAGHHHRIQNRIYAGFTFVAVCLWIPIYFEDISNRAKIAVAVVAIFFEQFAYLAGFSPVCARIFNLEFTTAVDIDHENDRYTAFTIIVLGEFTYYILVGSPAAGGLTFGYMRAVWTLVIAFCFNSMYVYTDGAITNTHPIRRSVYTAFAWLLIHLPMSAGLLIGGHVAAVSTGEELDSGKRWLWGGGLGFGTLCMWIIGQLYHDRDPPGKLQMSKVRLIALFSLAGAFMLTVRQQLRLLPRLLLAIMYVLVPLCSEEQLSTTSLVSLGAGASGFVVIWETIASLEKGACAFESWKGQVDTFEHIIDVHR